VAANLRILLLFLLAIFAGGWWWTITSICGIHDTPVQQVIQIEGDAIQSGIIGPTATLRGSGRGWGRGRRAGDAGGGDNGHGDHGGQQGVKGRAGRGLQDGHSLLRLGRLGGQGHRWNRRNPSSTQVSADGRRWRHAQD